MAKLNFEDLIYYNLQPVGKTQVAESIRVSVKNEIVDIISVGTDSRINSYEVGEATSFYGKTNLRLVYFDGASLQSANYSADFTASIEGTLPTDMLVFDVATLETRTETNANTATVNLLLEVSCRACRKHATAVLTGGDFFAKTEKAELTTEASVFSVPLSVERELSSTHSITTVLLAESSLCITAYTLSDGILRVSGDATSRLTYLSDGELLTDVIPFSFERELDAQGISRDNQLRITALTAPTKVRLNISENEDNLDFTVEIPASLRIEATKNSVIDIVTDGYSTSCDFDFERKSITSTLPCDASCQKTASISLPSDKKPVAAINVGATVINCTSAEGFVQVDGFINATLIYKGEHGFNGEPVELPFSQRVDAEYVTAKCACDAVVRVEQLDLSDGLTAGLCISLYCNQDVTYQIIDNAVEVPFDKTQAPAIEICLAAKGDTLWQLAKNLHMSEEELLATNPDISNPLQKDARLVVFNKIV